MLLDGRGAGPCFLAGHRKFAQVGGDVIALDGGQWQASGVRPGEETQRVAVIGLPRVRVGDGVG